MKKRRRTLVQLKKRLQVGTQIEQVWNSREGYTNHMFTVIKVQSKGVIGTCPDFPGSHFMKFPKRKEIIFMEDGWERFEGTTKIFEYVWRDEKDA